MDQRAKRILESRPLSALRRIGRALGQAVSQMFGVPDYDAYVAHMQRAHPERPAMNREQFFRDRQAARFSGARGGCC